MNSRVKFLFSEQYPRETSQEVEHSGKTKIYTCNTAAGLTCMCFFPGNNFLSYYSRSLAPAAHCAHFTATCVCSRYFC